MPKLQYFCDGYVLDDPNSHNWQIPWIVFFNPSDVEADVIVTFYYAGCDPTMKRLKVPAARSISDCMMNWTEVLHNERFGMKIESSESIIVQPCTAYYGPEDKKDLYTHAMHSVMGVSSLSKVNYYADLFVIDVPGQRLKEPEWVFLLNPGEVAARVTLHAYGSDGNQAKYDFIVPPCRLLAILMDETVQKNKLCGAKYVSDVPIAVQQTRLIEEMDRKTIRSCYSVMAMSEAECS